MASYNYFSGLFSGLGSTNSNFSLYSSLSDYSSIKSGSYKKLLNVHYGKTSVKSSDTVDNILRKKTDTSSVYSKKTSTSGKIADKSLTNVKQSSDELLKSATSLYTKGKDTVFSKNATSADIADGVKKFANNYNDLIDAAKNSTTKNVTNTLGYMESTVKSYSKSLENVGITIGDDGKLKVDSDKLSSASEDSLKGIFNGTNSLAFAVASKASTIGSYAVSAANYTGSSVFDQYL